VDPGNGPRRLGNTSLGTGAKGRQAVDQFSVHLVDVVADQKGSAMGMDDCISSDVGLHCAQYAAERRYFERVKESFAIAAGVSPRAAQDNWSEFLKCVDLYSQDLLQRSEMVQITSRLFRSRGISDDLFDAFKKMLQNRGNGHGNYLATFDQGLGKREIGQLMKDKDFCMRERASFLWASIPLHEIDFSRCKQGTPSYRGLPASMSQPICSARSHLELSVLNDVWVSQPVGTEETNSFKHVRKNHYQETLFRCEDERFELDMVIDANAAAIAALEKLNAEAQHKYGDSTTFRNDVCHGACAHLVGFVLEPVSLSSAHLNAILRVYGEHGTARVLTSNTAFYCCANYRDRASGTFAQKSQRCGSHGLETSQAKGYELVQGPGGYGQ
jgi:hypothetical protein